MATTPQLRPAERLVFFTDAVVAIAMTLLILPLLESVGDAAREGLDTISYLVENQGRLVAFALSFVIISVFWRSHDRLFELVERQDNVLLRLNVAWMFTIVWLSVATALVGSMPTDSLQLALYIGTMLATSLLTLAMRWWLGHRPELVAPGHRFDPSGFASMAVVSALFAVALLLAVLVPGLDYWAMLVLLLSAPLDALLARRRRP